MKTSLITAGIALAVVFAVLALSSCSATISSDGSKSATVNGAELIRAIEVLNQK